MVVTQSHLLSTPLTTIIWATTTRGRHHRWPGQGQATLQDPEWTPLVMYSHAYLETSLLNGKLRDSRRFNFRGAGIFLSFL